MGWCFEAIEMTPGRDFLLRLSMMEIYNEVSQRGWAPVAACLLAGPVMLLATDSACLRRHGLLVPANPGCCLLFGENVPAR